MQFKQSDPKPLTGLMKILLLICFITPFSAICQTTYLEQGAKENILLERMEIKAQTDSILNFSKTRPLSRMQVIPEMQSLDSSLKLSKVDQYNLYTAQLSNIEYANGPIGRYSSKKPFLNNYFKTPANLYEIHSKDFFAVLNPVFQFVEGKENNNSENIFLNTRGVVVRGNISDKIGFFAYITDNQERDPLYVQQWVRERQAVPGEGYFKNFKTTGYDYFDARGYITAKATKYIDIVFGYDKNFIGNGYRSLFLSDFSNNALFLKLNTRIWKFNYQNLFMELVTAQPRGSDAYYEKKYAAIHHLDFAVTKSVNVGLFEAIVFGRKNHFEFGYLNPVIFYRSVEQQSGSFDNALAGMDAKANIAHHVQLYGQLLLDEFKLSQLSKNWWGNKFGYQVGMKYIDALTISNLDLQLEWNRVRPFTYSHNDSVSNYTHNNQPLAHPLGANFNEVIAVMRYQPAPKWMFQAKAIYYMQGKDTGTTSYGSNIFLIDEPPFRTMEYGYVIGGGIKTKVLYTSFLLSYEVKPNLFFEANAVYRKQNQTILAPSGPSSFTIYAGIRWNMHRREFDF